MAKPPLNPEALEAACAGFYNDPMGLTNWQRLCSADPALADKYRVGMNTAVSAYLAALPAPRTITTVEELEALPIGSVVIINGTMLQATDRDDYGTMWSRVCDIDAYPSNVLDLPATVIHRPGRD